jgi:formylmethanofuran dehydrogenase subunit A
MFRAPLHVLKGGAEVARDGVVTAAPAGATQLVRPEYDRTIEGRVRRFFDDHMTIGFDHFPLADQELADAGATVEVRPCRARGMP